MKEVVLDTETTGLEVKDGHRIVEIGCIELENQVPTAKKFHCYRVWRGRIDFCSEGLQVWLGRHYNERQVGRVCD